MIRSATTKRSIASWRRVVGAPVLPGADSRSCRRPKGKNCGSSNATPKHRQRPARRSREEGWPHTILVADDDPTIVRLLTLALEQDGFRVVTASDGEAALRLARLEHPDLILLDWQMPSADGMEVTRRLRNEPDPALRDVPVVLITAQSGPENTAAGFAAGVTDYLTKPFRPAHVRARVQAWLLRRPAEAPRDT
jgi:Response regulators consisting of a CheY-like receiver domain and a winged-helix DNA-binding domain